MSNHWHLHMDVIGLGTTENLNVHGVEGELGTCGIMGIRSRGPGLNGGDTSARFGGLTLIASAVAWADQGEAEAGSVCYSIFGTRGGHRGHQAGGFEGHGSQGDFWGHPTRPSSAQQHRVLMAQNQLSKV
jgi:hypothetical protein